ncbi:MAG: NAD(P)H-dependent oxidoreductase [Candidatus Woesearchaeota archaeon]|nr:MAG: NAD(P)H-dependent oxidoreductase [Candidatus Woesearchaeota archaeon]
MEFKQLLEKRYATKKFTGESLSEEQVGHLLELIRLSPSSFGLQPFKVVVVQDAALKEKLFAASFNQPQITTSSHVLVFCATTQLNETLATYVAVMKQAGMPDDKAAAFSAMIQGHIAMLKTDEQKVIWSARQAYIAMTNALNGATALGFDSCPMEGFSPTEYAKILDLPAHLVPVVVVPIGVAADEPRPKLRLPKEDLFIQK